MGNGRRLSPWTRVAGQALLLGLGEWNYRRLPVARARPTENVGLVSIIIPARNESKSLPRLLGSLQALEYDSVEIIVVDDDSSDDTAEIAREMDCTVLEAGRVPNGWTGKCHACAIGASAATGEWLLFTDADTVHEPGSLAGALALALETDAALLSLLAAQECVTFWERIILPYAYALYFVGAIRANRSGGPAVANGQYMLFRRSSYLAVGGHTSVRNSIIEDVALAGTVRGQGGQVVLARGEDILSVRMYGSLRSLWEGFSKNAFRFLLASPATGGLTAIASMSVASTLPSALSGRPDRHGLAVLATPLIGLAIWYRRFGVSPGYAALYPLASGVFSLIALDSIRRAMNPGATKWQGRRY